MVDDRLKRGGGGSPSVGTGDLVTSDEHSRLLTRDSTPVRSESQHTAMAPVAASRSVLTRGRGESVMTVVGVSPLGGDCPKPMLSGPHGKAIVSSPARQTELGPRPERAKTTRRCHNHRTSSLRHMQARLSSRKSSDPSNPTPRRHRVDGSGTTGLSTFGTKRAARGLRKRCQTILIN